MNVLSALPVVTALSTVLATVPAQAAAFVPIAGVAMVGCGPFGAAVDHQPIGLPRLGSTFALRTSASNGDCGYLCNLHLLAIGTSNTAVGTVALPAMPQQIGLPGCGLLHISPDIQVWMPVIGSGSAQVTTSFAIPQDPVLAGQQFYVQSIAATWILGGLSAVAFGRASRGTIGY